jgi:DNA-binding MarR family transcriptional regulator
MADIPAHARWVAESMGEPALASPQSILDLLNYQLHMLLSFSTAGVTRICEQEFGITRHEWGYIGLLAAFGAMAPSQLALRSGMDRSRTSKALMPLLAKGLVSRSSRVGDRRYATVALTPAGRRLFDRIFPYALAVHQNLLQALTVNEAKVLARALGKLRPRAVALAESQARQAAARSTDKAPQPKGRSPRRPQPT